MRLPVLLLILLGAVAVLAVLSIPIYFAARRPRRGTTEWMRCIETPHFPPLHAHRLHPSDLGWLPLSVIVGVGLRLLLFLFRLSIRGFAVSEPLLLLSRYAHFTALPCAVLAAGMYLLIRLISGGTLAAICGAAAVSVLQLSGTARAAAVIWALLFLWLWVCSADAERPFLSALWAALSLVCLAAGLFLYARLLWLAPLWIAAWIYVQCRRRSVGRALVSLLLTVLLCAVCAAVICGIRLLSDSDAGQGIAPIRTAAFWQELLLLIRQKLSQLWYPLAPCDTVYAADALLFLVGGAALICALHGMLRWRESECLTLLLTVPFFAALWLFGGFYLLAIPLTLALGWLWSLWGRRQQTVFIVLSICILIVTDCVIILL